MEYNDDNSTILISFLLPVYLFHSILLIGRVKTIFIAKNIMESAIDKLQIKISIAAISHLINNYKIAKQLIMRMKYTKIWAIICIWRKR